MAKNMPEPRDGSLLDEILAPPQQPRVQVEPEESQPPPRTRKVRFADEEEPDEDVGMNYIGLNHKNMYLSMFEAYIPAIIAGVVVGLFQFETVRQLIGANISGVFSGTTLSIYGFFVFVLAGAVVYKMAEGVVDK